MDRRRFLGVVGVGLVGRGRSGGVVSAGDLPGVGGVGGTSGRRLQGPPGSVRPLWGRVWPVGGSVGQDDADDVLQPGDGRSLGEALGALRPGETLWVDGDCEVDCTAERGLRLPRRCVLASDRGSGRPGARLFTRRSPRPLLRLEAGSRLTGLRIEGPLSGPTAYDWRLESAGAGVVGSRVEVDRCLLRGWGHAGVEVGRDGTVSGTHVHHCQLLDNALSGLGYGVVVRHGEALLQFLYADGNRHAVACIGARDAGYELLNSYFGPRTYAHVVDMHRGEEVHPALGRQAGRYLDVHHNVFRATYGADGRPVSAVVVRGVPLTRSRVDHNWFAHAVAPVGPGRPGDAVVVDAVGRDATVVDVADNWFGAATPPAWTGIPTGRVDAGA
ncbi:hypothetical protein ACFO0N_07700 [Halobium salinum]|uniref:Right handed beta helix region n=1 Tax=Halobium salinum TaxID=1364940 RepID=A0ABD5PAD7_9EURY|nr:hypothetical protein [Halobium salinum]